MLMDKTEEGGGRVSWLGLEVGSQTPVGDWQTERRGWLVGWQGVRSEDDSIWQLHCTGHKEFSVGRWIFIFSLFSRWTNICFLFFLLYSFFADEKLFLHLFCFYPQNTHTHTPSRFPPAGSMSSQWNMWWFHYASVSRTESWPFVYLCSFVVAELKEGGYYDITT